LNKYPAKAPLWNFTSKAYFLPNRNSRAVTVQFLLDLLDHSNNSMFKITKADGETIPKYDPETTFKSPVDCGVIFMRINKFLRDQDKPTTLNYPDIPDYGYLQTIAKFLDPDDLILQIFDAEITIGQKKTIRVSDR
jgi:hypothetical protein